MSNQLRRIEREMPQPPPMPSTVLPFTREARAIATNDRKTVAEARQRFNRAQLNAFQTHLDSQNESVEIQQSARLTAHSMQAAVEVVNYAQHLAGGHSPAIEMMLSEMVAAHSASEVARIIKRGYGI